MPPAPSVAGPSDQGFSKRKYIFKGYMSEEQYVEVPPNPIKEALEALNISIKTQ